jgi:hypothetical protein
VLLEFAGDVFHADEDDRRAAHVRG